MFKKVRRHLVVIPSASLRTGLSDAKNLTSSEAKNLEPLVNDTLRCVQGDSLADGMIE